MEIEITKLIFVCIFGFLMGSVLYAKILPRLMCKIDITKVSKDGNPGAANVFHHCGMKCGIVTVIMEYFKGFMPVVIGLNILDVNALGNFFMLVIIAPVLGHMFSFMNRFDGGVGISACEGTMVAVFLETRVLIVVTCYYFLHRVIIHYKRPWHRTVAVWGSLAVTLLFFPESVYCNAYILLSALICIKSILRGRRVRIFEAKEKDEAKDPENES